MIHLLEVHPGLSVAEVAKLARRYAMTGGYELALDSKLSAPGLVELAQIWQTELVNMAGTNAEKRTSNAYRILCLIKNDVRADEATIQELSRILAA